MALVNQTRLFRGQGVLSVAELNATGSSTGYLDAGNVRALRLTFSVERIEHLESRTGKQTKDLVLERTRSARVEFEAESTVAEFLRRIFYGSTTDLGTITVTGEQVIAFANRKAKLDRINLTSFTSLTNSSGTYTYTPKMAVEKIVTNWVAATDVFVLANHGLPDGTRVRLSGNVPAPFSSGTNYFVVTSTTNNFQLASTFNGTPITGTTDANGVVVEIQDDYSINLKTGVIDFTPKIADTPSFADGITLLANYAAGTSETVAVYSSQNKNVALLFEGINTAESDAPVVLEIFKVRLDPPSEWSLIGDEFSMFSIAGEILYDETKIAAGGFMKISQQQLTV